MRDIEIKRIFSIVRANDLIRMGNQVYKIEEDSIYKGKVIFIFKRTNKLINDIEVLNLKYKK